MADVYDVAIIGGGHNGLTCAAYLAGGGLSVVVLEKNSVAGGAAVTEEFAPGFRNSVASYAVSLLNPKVIRDLALERHGLKIIERPVANFWPVDETRGLVMPYGLAGRQRAIAEFSARWVWTAEYNHVPTLEAVDPAWRQYGFVVAGHQYAAEPVDQNVFRRDVTR